MKHGMHIRASRVSFKAEETAEKEPFPERQARVERSDLSLYQICEMDL